MRKKKKKIKSQTLLTQLTLVDKLLLINQAMNQDMALKIIERVAAKIIIETVAPKIRIMLSIIHNILEILIYHHNTLH
jgi:type I site-specific restriction endonuclease